MGSAGFAMALSDIMARSTMAFCWESPNWANREAEGGLVRASVRARANRMAALTEKVFGTGHWCEKNALFWRCARIWSSLHTVGSSNSVQEQGLNTSRRPHGGPSAAVSGDLEN